MAFPAVAEVVKGTWTGTVGEYTDVPLDALTPNVGDLILAMVAVKGTPSFYSSSSLDKTGGTTWNSLSSITATSTYAWRSYWCYYGGSGAYLRLRYDATAIGVYMIYRFTGGYQPQQGSSVYSSGPGWPDPPSASHVDGALDHLWITTTVTIGDVVADAGPTNYGNLQTQAGDATNGVSFSSSRRELNASSENAGAWDFTSTSYTGASGAVTMAISPKHRTYLEDFTGPQIDVNLGIGHIYTMHPYKFSGPRMTVPKLNVYSGRFAPLPLVGGAADIPTLPVGQIHVLGLNDFTGPQMSAGAMSAADNTTIGSQQFMFAWVDPGETTFGVAHHRNDEDVFAFELSHIEGDFATLSVDVINPRVGLLGPGRKRWAYLSWNNGSTIEPLFFGRLVGVPQSMQGEVVRLQFIARPQNYDTVKAALADTMRTAPYYDPIWYSEEARVDPDIVLEGRPELWHIDRVTHDVTSSNVLVGEDGTVDLGTNHFYDALDVSYSEAPGRVARVQATVAWRQLAVGYVDITNKFPARIETYTHTGLLDDWPDPDQDIGGGWSVWDVAKVRLDRDNPLTLSFSLRLSGFNYKDVTLGKVEPETAQFYIADGSQALWYKARIKPYMVLKYDVEREYAEVATFDLTADVQPLITEAGEDEIIQITMSCNADDPIDGTAPIGDLRSPTFYHQARGREALEHVVYVARAQLMARSRVIDISAQVPFSYGVQLSCRKNVSIDDDRLPGGTASGKVKAYSLTLDGDSGEAVATIQIGATVGNGGSVSDAEGTPRYVDTGYVDIGWQAYSDAATALADGDVTIGDYSDVAVNDDGIRFDTITADDVVDALQIINPASTQESYVRSGPLVFGNQMPSAEYVAELFNEVYTEVFLDVHNLTDQAPFETQFPITVSLLKLPKTIDLEAE